MSLAQQLLLDSKNMWQPVPQFPSTGHPVTLQLEGVSKEDPQVTGVILSWKAVNIIIATIPTPPVESMPKLSPADAMMAEYPTVFSDQVVSMAKPFCIKTPRDRLIVYLGEKDQRT